MLNWRVYYEDGSVADDTTPREQVPRVGVLVIAQADPHVGNYLSYNRDWYVLRKGRWQAMDHIGLMDMCLYRLDELELVLAGRWTTRENFDKTFDKASNDPDLPPRTAEPPVWG